MRRLILVLVFLVVALGATTFYFYKNSKLSDLTSPVSQDEAKDLVDKVGKLILLPKNEIPTIGSITDLKPFRGQAFFIDAKIGYKVLLYKDAKKAVLYDPVANKIINFSTFSIDDKNITSNSDSTIIIDGGDTTSTSETP